MCAEKTYTFPTQVDSIASMSGAKNMLDIISDQASDLYQNFERDFIYLPDTYDAVVSRTQSVSAGKQSDRDSLVHEVFSQFDSLINPDDWQLNSAEVIDFLWDRVEQESRLIAKPELSESYARVRHHSHNEQICKYYLSQFALDYLTEASPLTKMLPGSFGDLQMAIFKIISDEYGGGNLAGKHSVLFQNTLKSLNMPTDLEYYKPTVLNSVYMYMSYVNRLCDDKSQFFRFLGFLFVYEACLIYASQQQGLLLREVFGEQVDTEYFDLHVDIDQHHGVWVLEKLLIPVINKYGEPAAKDILRGYHETTYLLDMCDVEMEAAANKAYS